MSRGQKLAIDIGNSHIKILYGNNKKIFKAVLIPTPENSVKESIIVDIEKVSAAINEYILVNNLRVRGMYFSLDGQDAVIRHIEIPILDNKKLQEEVVWEMSQYLPDRGINYFIDYKIIDRENTVEKKVYKLLIVAVLKDRVNQFVKLAEMLNLRIDAVDIAANCLSRVFINVCKKEKDFKTIGIIDIGCKSSSISILGNGKLFMVKEASFGIMSLLDEADNFDLGKINSGSERDRRILECLDNASAIFLKVIEFYTTGKVEKKLDAIYVIGGGSKIKGIENYFSTCFSSPINVVYNLEMIGRKIHYPEECDISLQLNTLGLLLRKE